MNKTLTALLAAVVAGLAFTAPVHAASDARREAIKERFQNMTPEEKAAAKEKARAKWDAMTPEQQAAAKKRFAEKHPDAAKAAEERKAQPAPAN
jgi:hypothetical protein